MLMVLGAGHHDVNLTQLENLAECADSVRSALHEAAAGPDGAIAGSVVLSTCNRLEIYIDAVRFHDAVGVVTGALASATAMAAEHAQDWLRVRVGAAVATHLFTVAAGLDAMVVGEVEIAGQVARAHRRAESEVTLTPELHRLFRSAARTAKAVAAQTRIGAEGRSVASVALDIAVRRLGPLDGRSALIVGTGSYARVVATVLRARGCTDLAVHSPSGRTDAFAVTHQATAVDHGELAAVLGSVDLLVAASGRGSSLDAGKLGQALAQRNRPLLAVDLALHHDIPDSLRALPGVEVIDLHSIAGSVRPAHGEEMRAAQHIVLAAVSRFQQELTERTVDPAVVALRSHVFAAVDAEVRRLRRKYDGQVADDVERAIRRVTSSLLHTPTIRARELARDGSGEDYLRALHTLFGIEVPSTGSSNG
jgi:glutamyl-tRNA reductase